MCAKVKLTTNIQAAMGHKDKNGQFRIIIALSSHVIQFDLFFFLHRSMCSAHSIGTLCALFCRFLFRRFFRDFFFSSCFFFFHNVCICILFGNSLLLRACFFLSVCLRLLCIWDLNQDVYRRNGWLIWPTGATYEMHAAVSWKNHGFYLLPQNKWRYR